MKNVIVTGVGGFLGSKLAHSLSSQGWKVAGVGHKGLGAELIKSTLVSWITEDVTTEALRKTGLEEGVIFHCAGGSSVAKSYTDPHTDFLRSSTATSAVLDFARKSNNRFSIVYVSSAGVYGNSESFPIPEETALRPTSPYGLHKLIGEQLCQMYGACFGVANVRVRLFSLFGAGLRKQLLWDACNKLLHGDYKFGGTGSETRDWIHESDAVSLLILAATQATPESPVFNGGTGISPTVNEVLTWMGDQMGCVAAPSFSDVVRIGDPPHYRARIRKIQQLGWTPKVHWKNGIADYVDWFRSQLNTD